MKGKWIWVALLCNLGLLGYDVENPALNKVRFIETPIQKAVTLVADGKLKFAIIVDPAAEHHLPKNLRVIPRASKTLAVNMEKCFGVRPEILEIGTKEALTKFPCRIYVGQSAATRKYGIKPETAGREGFIITTVPDGIAIVGNDSSLDPEFRKDPNDKRGPRKATLWGVYDFLERFCGCRFYYPGEMGSLHPKAKNLTITPIAYTDKPYFINRHEGHVPRSFASGNRKKWETLLGPVRDLASFWESWRLATTSEFFAGHNPRPERILAAYPDMKDLIFYKAPNGNLYYNPDQHTGNYFDVTNLKFADLLVESLKKYYASNGKINDGWVHLSSEFIPFGQCDTEVPLPDMINHPAVIREKLITKAILARGKFYYSDIYGRFYQYFGNRVKKELPGKKIVIIPYSKYAQAPLDKRWVLPDNFEARVCSGSLPTYTRNKKKMAELKKNLEGWYKALGNRPVISLWLYNVPKNPFARAVVPQFICDIPKIFEKTLGNMELYLDHYHEGLEYYHYCANYAGYRGMWNPDFDYEAAIEEHWIPFYGKDAGPELREFHKLLNECFMKFHLPQDDLNPLYPVSYLDKMEAHLKKAQKVVEPGTIEARRVAFYLTPWKDAIAAQRNRHTYNRPIYGAHQLLPSEKVTIDGKMEEPFWKDVKIVPMIDPTGSGTPRKNPPAIRLAWDKTGFYGFLKGNWNPQIDSSIWKNCNVELFFSPGVKKEQYFQIVFDAGGKTFSGQKELHPVEKPFNGNWKFPNLKYAVLHSGKDWSLEFFIPFGDMKVDPPKAYESWIMNLISNKAAGEKEYSASALTMNNNHNIDLHGYVKFLGKGE